METTLDKVKEKNPYSHGTRKATNWDVFVDNLGFRSGWTRYQEERKQKEAEWDAQIESMKHEEEYNSAQEQVARERAAGLNPDLTGDISAGEATEMTEPEHLSSAAIDEASAGSKSSLANIAAVIFSTINGAGTLALMAPKAIQEIKSLKLGNILKGIESESGKIKNTQEMAKLAQEAVESGLFKTIDDEGNAQFTETAKIAAGGGKAVAKFYGFEGKQAETFERIYNALANSEAGDITKTGFQITKTGQRIMQKQQKREEEMLDLLYNAQTAEMEIKLKYNKLRADWIEKNRDRLFKQWNAEAESQELQNTGQALQNTGQALQNKGTKLSNEILEERLKQEAVATFKAEEDKEIADNDYKTIKAFIEHSQKGGWYTADDAIIYRRAIGRRYGGNALTDSTPNLFGAIKK